MADMLSLDWIADPTAWLGLATLIALEIVLGIDNLIFVAILADKLPAKQRDRARVIGLGLALFMRLALLASISWLTSLTQPLIAPFGFELSGRDLILFAGGLFLLYKSTTELHERLEGAHGRSPGPSMRAGFWATVAQIIVLDAVFSLDSVITAVGMVNELLLMMVAVVIAVVVMIVASGPLMRFVSAHPTVVILCLGFLLMIGFSLVLDGFHVHVPKGYLYAAIGFSVMVEALNQIGQRNRRRAIAGTRNLRARTADAVLRLLGAPQQVGVEVEDEVAALVSSISRDANVFEPAEKEMVRGVFQLADLPVRSIMTPLREVVWIDVSAPPDAIRVKILAGGRSRYPLARGSLDNLVGVALTQDLLRDLDQKRAIGAKTCANQPLIVPPGLSALRLLERFRRDRNHFAVVVNEYGQVQGVATPTDVLEAIAGELPEPGDAPAAGQREVDGAWLFGGGVDLRHVMRETGANLPVDQPYTTLAGHVLARFGRLPAPGEAVSSEGYSFEVVSLDGRRIDKVRVRRVAPAEAASAKTDDGQER